MSATRLLIVSVCSLCPKVKGGGPIPQGAMLSHGICPECWDSYRREQGLEARPYPGGAW